MTFETKLLFKDFNLIVLERLSESKALLDGIAAESADCKADILAYDL